MEYLVWSSFLGIEEKDGETIDSVNDEDAAKTFARIVDKASDYQRILPLCAPVCVSVKDVATGNVTEYKVVGYSEPTYEAIMKAPRNNK